MCIVFMCKYLYLLLTKNPISIHEARISGRVVMFRSPLMPCGYHSPHFNFAMQLKVTVAKPICCYTWHWNLYSSGLCAITKPKNNSATTATTIMWDSQCQRTHTKRKVYADVNTGNAFMFGMYNMPFQQTTGLPNYCS